MSMLIIFFLSILDIILYIDECQLHLKAHTILTVAKKGGVFDTRGTPPHPSYIELDFVWSSQIRTIKLVQSSSCKWIEHSIVNFNFLSDYEFAMVFVIAQ